MNDGQAAARELLTAAKELMAGNMFSSAARDASVAHSEMMEAVGRIENALHYRLYGDGHKDDITGEPTLTPSETSEARDIRVRVLKIKSALEKMDVELRGLGMEAKKLDSFMRFS
jgi:hypothetical protein